MTTGRRSIGIGTIFISAAGFLLCLAGIVGVWAIRNRVQAVATAAVSVADDSLAFVDAQIERVKLALDRSRKWVNGFAGAAERLVDRKEDITRNAATMLQTLEEVSHEMKTVGYWLDSCDTVARDISRVSEAVISSEYSAPHEESSRVVMARRIQEIADSVAGVLARLQVVRQELTQIRDDGQVRREIVTRIVAHILDLGSTLTNLSLRLENLDVKASDTRAACVDLGQTVDWWTKLTASSLSIVFVWFAVSQVNMMRLGKGLLQDDRARV